MISNLIKEHKRLLWDVIQKNNTTKQKMKTIDSLWKQIEGILSKNFKSLLK